MKQQQRMVTIMNGLIKKIRSKEWLDAKKRIVGLGVAGKGLRESMNPHRMGKIPCRNGTNG